MGIQGAQLVKERGDLKSWGSWEGGSGVQSQGKRGAGTGRNGMGCPGNPVPQKGAPQCEERRGWGLANAGVGVQGSHGQRKGWSWGLGQAGWLGKGCVGARYGGAGEGGLCTGQRDKRASQFSGMGVQGGLRVKGGAGTWRGRRELQGVLVPRKGESRISQKRGVTGWGHPGCWGKWSSGVSGLAEKWGWGLGKAGMGIQGIAECPRDKNMDSLEAGSHGMGRKRGAGGPDVQKQGIQGGPRAGQGEQGGPTAGKGHSQYDPSHLQSNPSHSQFDPSSPCQCQHAQ